jgi:3'-phosphoadenosine 5'-phosphosulfate sulfotransferase (PAPS reductase)/FAD synthetase
MKSKPIQETIFGEKPFKVRNKKIIKSTGLKFYPPTAETSDAIMDDLEKIHGRTKFYALTSGGKDSITLAHWLAERGQLEAGVHIKTNIGFQATTDFVIDFYKEMNWPLHVIEPSPKFTYAAHVLQYGFPGPGFHRLIMGKLKYKTMRDFALTIDRKNHCLISGVRKFESVRRMGNYPEPIQSDGSLWFACPFFYKKTEELYKYLHVNNLKITPIHKELGMSGECMCGSFAQVGEKDTIRRLDPKLADYIQWLEVGIKKFGTPAAKRYAKWGNSPLMTDLEDQKQMDFFFKDNPDLKIVNDIEALVCGDECGAGTLKGMMDI